MIDFKKDVLPNGMKIITSPHSQTKAVSVLFLINAGSRYESKEQNGIFHFMEHMLFKGTKKRPTFLEISKELDGVGAEFNAFTGDELTGFYISSIAKHFDLSLDVLSDIILNSQFPLEEIKKEKGVILEEINMYQDLPQRNIQDLAKKQIFGDTALGRSTVGIAKTVSAISRNDLIKLKENFYHPQNIIAIVCGATNGTDWQKTISEKFSKIKSKPRILAEANEIAQNKTNLLLNYKKTDQAHLIIGFRSFSRFDKRRWALKILNNIMGETMSSRLFTEVREKRGLAYYVGSDSWQFSDSGAQISYAGVDIKRADKAIKVILDEYKKLIKEKVTKEEINRAKENIIGKMYLNLEDSYSIAEFLGEQELLYNEIIQPEKIADKLSNITANDIHDLAKEIFISQNLNISIIGPFKEKNRFENLLKF